MIALGPVSTAADYPTQLGAGCSLGPSYNARVLLVNVIGNNVLCQIGRGQKGQWAWLDEFSLITSTIVFAGNDIVAVRFRDETPRAHGTVRAQIFEEPDPLPASFGPIFSAGLGGINMNVYHDAALVGNEPGIDFVDGGGLTWTLADVSGDRVTVAAAVTSEAVVYRSTFSVSDSAALTTLLSQALSGIQAGSFVEVELAGAYLNNTGGNKTLMLAAGLTSGGTLTWQDTSGAINASANRRALSLRATFGVVIPAAPPGLALTTMAGQARLSSTSAPTAGIGALSGSDLFDVEIGSRITASVGATPTLLVQVQHSAADPNLVLEGVVTAKVYA